LNYALYLEDCSQLSSCKTAAVGALMLLAVANALAQSSDALSLKATEAVEITAIAKQNGLVRVIVMFDSPVPAGQLKSDPSSVANAKAQVAAAQDAIVAVHSAASPIRGKVKALTAGLPAFRPRRDLPST
jgi:uncharacterized protein (DUF2141 family)